MLKQRAIKVDGVLLPGSDLSLLAIRPKYPSSEDSHLSVILVANHSKKEYVTWIYNWNDFSCNDGHYHSSRNDLEDAAAYASANKDFDERAYR